tara:strand:- start:365 stop:562 length:198 start_codon:yes stop_codon:yes gene_type:complete
LLVVVLVVLEDLDYALVEQVAADLLDLEPVLVTELMQLDMEVEDQELNLDLVIVMDHQQDLLVLS